MKSIITFCLFIVCLNANSMWKDNSSVLQNQDTLMFDFHSFEDSSIKEPFTPPDFLKNTPLQKNHLLELPREPIIPQINPDPLKVPDIEFKPDDIFEKDFIVSYKFLLKDEVPVGEKYNISEPLVSMKNPSFIYQCSIDVFLDDDMSGMGVLDMLLKELLQYHKEDVLECLYKSGVEVKDESMSNNNASKNKTLFTLLPKRIRVSLQNGFLIIKVFKENK